jgi:hypothetical protein
VLVVVAVYRADRLRDHAADGEDGEGPEGDHFSCYFDIRDGEVESSTLPCPELGILVVLGCRLP